MEDAPSPVLSDPFLTGSGRTTAPEASASIALPDVRLPLKSLSSPQPMEPIFPQLPKPSCCKCNMSPRHYQDSDFTGASTCRHNDAQTLKKSILRVDCNLVNYPGEECKSVVHTTNDVASIVNPVTPSPHHNAAISPAFFVVGGSTGHTCGLSVDNEVNGSERLTSSSCRLQGVNTTDDTNVVNHPNLSNRGGKRVGYDGTRRTPSNQLLRPTASSISKRVKKVAHSSALLSTPSHRYPPAKVQATSRHCPYTPPSGHSATKITNDSHKMPNNQSNKTPTKEMDKSMKKMTIGLPFRNPSTPPPSSINPFQHLNESYCSVSKNSTMDDDEMEQINKTPNKGDDSASGRMMQQSGDVLNCSSFEYDPSLERVKNLSTPTSIIPAGSRHRSFSWSPGSKISQDAYDKFYGCSQQIRSSMYDPVASLLLTCVEEIEGHISPSFSFEEMNGCPLDSSNQELVSQAPFSPSVSMPNLNAPPTPTFGAKSGDEVDVEFMKEEPSPLLLSRIPASPGPLFRKVSGSLHDVKTDEDLNCLARPIPRKFSTPLAITPRDEGIIFNPT